MDLDQGRHFVGPDLGPNCLQRISADDSNLTFIWMRNKLILEAIGEILLTGPFIVNFLSKLC